MKESLLRACAATRTTARAAMVASAAAGFVMTTPTASAQVRWDVEAATGIARRFLTSKTAYGSNAEVGPSLDLSGHLALVPLVRVGLYAHYDGSKVSDQDARQLFAGGLDVRFLFPWPRGDSRLYARLGLGEVGVSASHDELAVDPHAGAVFIPATGGNFTEVPLALGLLYRVHAPLWLMAEAGARFGFAFSGSAYHYSLPASAQYSVSYPRATSGDDFVALYVNLGVMWGR